MNNKRIISYFVGFFLSAILTLLAYNLVLIHITSTHESISHEVLIPLIMGIALLQMIVQLIFFLHLLEEKGPRWNLVIFVMTASTFFMVVVASIWIMNNLNYRMTPRQVNQYIQDQAGGF